MSLLEFPPRYHSCLAWTLSIVVSQTRQRHCDPSRVPYLYGRLTCSNCVLWRRTRQTPGAIRSSERRDVGITRERFIWGRHRGSKSFSRRPFFLWEQRSTPPRQSEPPGLSTMFTPHSSFPQAHYAGSRPWPPDTRPRNLLVSPWFPLSTRPRPFMCHTAGRFGSLLARPQGAFCDDFIDHHENYL